MYEGDSLWSRKGATLSDKSVRQEFGLTQQEIVAAINTEDPSHIIDLEGAREDRRHTRSRNAGELAGVGR